MIARWVSSAIWVCRTLPRRSSTTVSSGLLGSLVRNNSISQINAADKKVAGILGAGRGIDEGLVGGMISLKSFKDEFPLEVGSPSQIANRESNITSMVQLGSIGGALLAFILCDRIGRVRSLQALTFLWAIGFVIVVTSFGNIGQILAGRLIAGLGVGMTTVVGPTYLAEVAPKEIRGMLTNIFAGAVYLGVMIAYFANWGCSENISDASRSQWVIPQSIHIMFAG